MDDPTRRAPAHAPDQPGDAAVTGVARGSLGTATALDETQEWVIPPELQAAPDPAPRVEPAPAAIEPAAIEPAAQRPIATDPAAIEPAAKPPRQAAVAAAPVIQPARPSRPVDRSPSPRTAGIAVALLLGAIAVVGVLSSLGSFAAPGQVPPGADQSTTAPAATEAADTDDDDDDEGGGNDGGGRGGGNGGGNGGGRGNGNGGGNGGGGGRGND